ncbi:L-threonylcarbamoyladenylate synthase [Solicola sp. PLA-1-18]|uniref:L-threonylcarbamoyladenylate synthase n=1 Tax=Solicola sp. PLA-1-18 TaxID=3380532 RepID=UPI003B81F577
MSERFSLASEDDADAGVDAARDALARGDLVVLPTDTVYGLAADAFEPTAVDRLRAAKGRGRDMPPPVLVASPTTLDALATAVPLYVREMVEDLWPGPLTIVCRQQPSLTWDLGDSRSTVAVRMPDHPHALALLKQTGPLAVSSANLTGQPPAEDVDLAEAMLGEAVAVYLDGGPASGGPASTIVDVTREPPRVLRLGGIDLETLRAYHPDLEGPDGEGPVRVHDDDTDDDDDEADDDLETAELERDPVDDDDDDDDEDYTGLDEPGGDRRGRTAGS